MSLASNARLSLHFQLDAGHWRLRLGKKDVIQVQVRTGALEILYLEAFNLDFLDQFLLVCIQCIKGIDAVMRGLMGCGVVQDKERPETLQSALCGISFHLLGLIHDDDGPVSCNHIDGLTGAEVIALRVDDAAGATGGTFLHIRSKGLRVDNHHVDASIRREGIQLLQVGRVVDKETSLFAIVLHEMVLQHSEGFMHALTDSNGRDHHNELGPAVTLVELEHRFDIDIRLSCTGLHFDVQPQTAQSV